jgi:hypothetical protein
MMEATGRWLTPMVAADDEHYQDRMRVVEHAYEQLGPAETVRSRWVAFVGRARQ